ncbi:MAG: hypothetical protein ACKO9Z_17750, partial [Planctomycetota bacterium]
MTHLPTASLSGWWLGLEAPADAAVSSFRMLPDSTGIALSAVVLAACAGGAIWAYRSELSAARGALRAGLATLRILAIAILCTWLFHPVSCSGTMSGKQDRPIAIILDDSQSMKQADLRSDEASRQVARDAGVSEKCSRVELGKALLEKNLEEISKDLDEKGGSRWYLAGPDLERFPDARAAMERWTASREGSD